MKRRIALLLGLALATGASATRLTGVSGVLAAAGDFNGDGYDDLLLGDPNFSGPEVGEGAAYLFLGGPDGIPDGDATTAAARFESDRAQAGLGTTGAAGDFDGDGLSDIALGIPKYTDVPQLQGGAVLVFRGRQVPQNGTPATADAVIRTDLDGWITGVASAGDVNGDGYDDLIAFGPTDLFVFHGSADGIPSGGAAHAANVLHVGSLVLAERWSFAHGDVNGDGYDDLLLLTYQVVNGIYYVATVYLHLGGASGIPTGLVEDADTVFPLQSFEDEGVLPFAEIGMGDVNGDGFDDVVIAAEGPTLANTRSIAVYFGSAGGIPSGAPEDADARLTEGSVTFYDLGTTGAVLDFDGDGYADIATSVTVATVGPAFSWWSGGPEGPLSGSVDPSAMPSIPFVGDSAGDLNHDGYGDMAGTVFASGSYGVEVLYGPEPSTVLSSAIACAALAGLRRRRAA
jgi:hypothetical protein